MSSLRQRISIGVVGITSGVVLIAAIGSWLVTRAELMHGLDRELGVRVERLRQLDLQGWINNKKLPGTSEDQIDNPDQLRFVQFVDPTTYADLMYWSPVSGIALTRETIVAAVTGKIYTGDLNDGRQVRIFPLRLSRPVTVFAPLTSSSPHAELGNSTEAAAQEEQGHEAEALALSVADIAPVNEELLKVATKLAVMWLVATALAWIAVLSMRSTILRPITELMGAIDQLGPDDLAVRIAASVGPDEVRGITTHLNGLLDRLEQAFRREHATIANIAHELRTPVTSLRTAIEFRLLASPSVDERKVLSSCLTTVEHMQAMVTNLLLLARLEAGKEPLTCHAIDIVSLIAEVVESWDVRSSQRKQMLAMTMPDHAWAMTSDFHVRLIISNVLSNAIAHGLEDQPITISVTEEDGMVYIAIANRFSGTVDIEQLGKSFYRGDDARSGGGHSGLGLALCRRLALLLGGTVEITAVDDRFEVLLMLPRVEQDASI